MKQYVFYFDKPIMLKVVSECFSPVLGLVKGLLRGLDLWVLAFIKAKN
jgi:hypothetical protein